MVHKITMIDLAMSPDEARDFAVPSFSDQPRYPYGLCISFTEKELEKLDLPFDEICVGDIVHMHCFAVVTSKSSNETQDGKSNQRVELQIEKIAAEDEAEEDKAMSVSEKLKKLYKNKEED